MADVSGAAVTENKGSLEGPDAGKRLTEGFPPPDNSTGDARAPDTYLLTTPIADTAQEGLQHPDGQRHCRHGRQRRAPRERLGLRGSSVKRARVQDAGAPTQSTCLPRQQCMNLSIPMTVRRTAISVSRLAAPRRSDSLPKILWIDKTGPFCGFQRETYPTGLQTDMKDILPSS